MTIEQKREAWVRFQAGALASGKTAQEASVEADMSVEELEKRDVQVQQQQQEQP